MTSPQPLTRIEIHNSGSRSRKRCRYRFYVTDVLGWQPRRRAVALYVGSALDAALKAFYDIGSRDWVYKYGSDDVPFPSFGQRVDAGWNALRDYIDKAREVDVEDVVKERFEELEATATAMWLNYVEWAEVHDTDIDPVVMEFRFVGNIGQYQDPATGQVIDLQYGGELDGLFVFRGGLYILENKTSGQPSVLLNSLDRDEQATRYHWATERMVRAGVFEHLGIPRDMPVRGSMFNVLWRRAPSPVAVNQNGTLSKQAKVNSVQDYLAALLLRGYVFTPGKRAPSGAKQLSGVVVPYVESLSAYGERTAETNQCEVAPILPKGMSAEDKAKLTAEWDEQHKDTLLRLGEYVWNQRHLVDRTPAQLQLAHTQLYWEAVDEYNLRMHPETAFRNPTFNCTIDCSILDVCTAELRGEPVGGLLEEFYVNKYQVAAMGEGLEEVDEDEEFSDFSDVGF